MRFSEIAYNRTVPGSADRLSLERIARAAREIDPRFRATPQFAAESLSEELGVRVVVKVETVNPVGSFKGRGADFFLGELPAAEAARGLVCASAGNFGLGLAFAARRRSAAVTVFASRHANPLKVERMRALGATVRLGGDDFDEAKSAARRFAAARGATMVEDGREAAISEGAGSIAVELLAGPEELDELWVPLGNGALAAGVARWTRAHRPDVRIVAVAAEGAPAMAESLAAGHVVSGESAATIADGLAVRLPVPEAVADLAGRVDAVLLVSDAAMIEAMRLAHRHLGLVLEPAGAAGLAAIAARRRELGGRRVATVLCGSNADPRRLARWLS